MKAAAEHYRLALATTTARANRALDELLAIDVDALGPELAATVERARGAVGQVAREAEARRVVVVVVGEEVGCG